MIIFDNYIFPFILNTLPGIIIFFVQYFLSVRPLRNTNLSLQKSLTSFKSPIIEDVLNNYDLRAEELRQLIALERDKLKSVIEFYSNLPRLNLEDVWEKESAISDIEDKIEEYRVELFEIPRDKIKFINECETNQIS